MKEFINEKLQKQIEKEIHEQFDEDFLSFQKKCQIGQNDSYICSLIREDSVEEFISYINRNNLSLLSTINKSVYETNSFLINKQPTLIEYASFFGSIQIIRYLKYNKVPLTSSLWLYVIHSNNAELIHFLQENEVKPKLKKTYSFLFEKGYNKTKKEKSQFDDAFIESVICYHNDITIYIKDNLLNDDEENDQIHMNFYFYPNVNDIICKPRINGKLNLYEIYGLCTSITTIIIPSSVTSIGDSAFLGCLSLKQINFVNLSSETSIDEQDKCSSLQQKSFQNNLYETSIGEQAFYECLSLIQITIASSLTSIGKCAFYKCPNLKQITIPSYITSIGQYAFYGCLSLSQIEISTSSISDTNNDFTESSSSSQTITHFLISIESYAFYNCSLLKKITIPSYIASIGQFAFYGCLLLTAFEYCESLSIAQIKVPSSVTSIGDNAFYGCSSLTQISIPSSVTSIGDNAFYGCSSLTQISIPSSVTSFGTNVFTGIRILEITRDVKIIINKAFDGLTSLIEITIPSSVMSIGDHAFYKCSSLKQVLFEKNSSLISIGLAAFCGCSSLSQITIPSSVTSIGQSAFYECSSLKQVILENPSSLISIGKYAFNKCPLLSPEFIKLISK